MPNSHENKWLRLAATVLTGLCISSSWAAPPIPEPIEVEVVNTPEVSVANTPDVSVVNTPDVSVANTPDVSVVNTPNVVVSNTPDVNVVNQAALAFDDLGQQRYSVSSTDSFAREVFGPLPPGQALMISLDPFETTNICSVVVEWLDDPETPAGQGKRLISTRFYYPYVYGSTGSADFGDFSQWAQKQFRLARPLELGGTYLATQVSGPGDCSIITFVDYVQ